MADIDVVVRPQINQTIVTIQNGVNPANIGALSNLDTADKSNIVNAINEVNAKVEDIATSDYTALAGSALSSGRVVSIVSGVAVYFDPADLAFYGLAIGITKTSAIEGGAVSIKLNGAFYESGLGLTPDALYFAGEGGVLVTDPTGLKIVQSVGSALDTDTLNININSPIETI